MISARNHIVSILSNEFKLKKETGKGLSKIVNGYWSKLKKRLPLDLVQDFENNPEDSTVQNSFALTFDELMKHSGVKMNTVMFLYNQGIEL